MRTISFVSTLTLASFTPAAAQVVLTPEQIKPASIERISARVANQIADPIIEFRLTVPEVVDVLGVDAPADWTFWLERATDSTPQVIGFTGGGVSEWEMEEFAFMGRLQGDSKRQNLVFPAAVIRASGTETVWARTAEADAPPPTMVVQGTTAITPWGTMAAAAGAFGIACLALGFSIVKSRPRPEG